MDAPPRSLTYTATHGGDPVSFTLDLASTGTLRGRMVGLGGRYDLHGLGALPDLQGTLVDASTGHRLSFSAQVQEHSLLLLLFPLDDQGQIAFEAVQTLTLHPEVPAEEPAAPAPATKRPAPADPPPALPPERAVAVNGHPLSAAHVGRLEGYLRASVPDGRYWYDATSGAWGAEGRSPVAFLAAALDLPGPMPADASGGGTGLFVNGRELHPQEVRALARRFGAAPPGRYRLDADGNLGVEDGPFLLNLRTAPEPAGAPPASAPQAPALPEPPRPTGTLRRSPAFPSWTSPFRA